MHLPLPETPRGRHVEPLPLKAGGPPCALGEEAVLGFERSPVYLAPQESYFCWRWYSLESERCGLILRGVAAAGRVLVSLMPAQGPE